MWPGCRGRPDRKTCSPDSVASPRRGARRRPMQGVWLRLHRRPDGAHSDHPHVVAGADEVTVSSPTSANSRPRCWSRQDDRSNVELVDARNPERQDQQPGCDESAMGRCDRRAVWTDNTVTRAPSVPRHARCQAMRRSDSSRPTLRQSRQLADRCYMKGEIGITSRRFQPQRRIPGPAFAVPINAAMNVGNNCRKPAGEHGSWRERSGSEPVAGRELVCRNRRAR